MRPSGFPKDRWPSPPVHSDRLSLRLAMPSDVEAIYRACVDPSTRWGVHLLPKPYLRRHALGFVSLKRAQFRQRISLALAITKLSDPTLVGMIELMHLSLGEQRAELGYWISPGSRGQGYATEAAIAMCDIGFQVLRLHRIEAGALARNRASLHVLEKAGFRREGIFRQRSRVGREWVDQVWLARLAGQ